MPDPQSQPTPSPDEPEGRCIVPVTDFHRCGLLEKNHLHENHRFMTGKEQAASPDERAGGENDDLYDEILGIVQDAREGFARAFGYSRTKWQPWPAAAFPVTDTAIAAIDTLIEREKAAAVAAVREREGW